MWCKGKVCVITGAAHGIGQATARAFAIQGACVAMIDQNEAGGRAMERELGADALFFPGDIADPAVLEAFARAVTDRFGRVDYLVNNAMRSEGGLLSGCGWEAFSRALAVGVSAPYYLTKLLTPHFAPGAAIVNIASTRAHMSQPGTESYSAAKGGICALTHALAVTLAGKARVNSISPGWIDTTGAAFAGPNAMQHPVQRVGVPEDIAQAVLFLCSDKASFITGQDLVIDGGMSKQMIYHDDFGWSLKS